MEKKDIDLFEKLSGQFSSTYDELAVISKKSPNDAVNKFKLGFINTLLEKGNEFLGEEYKPFDDFSTFNVDNVPHNSDVVFIVSQYIQCFEKFRADNVVQRGGRWYWEKDDKDDEEEKSIQTTRPKKLRE